MKTCIDCLTENNDASQFCVKCGSEFVSKDFGDKLYDIASTGPNIHVKILSWGALLLGAGSMFGIAFVLVLNALFTVNANVPLILTVLLVWGTINFAFGFALKRLLPWARIGYALFSILLIVAVVMTRPRDVSTLLYYFYAVYILLFHKDTKQLFLL